MAKVVRAGVVVLFFAALASAWELFARQAPGSPLYLGVLPGPVRALRELAFALGVLLLAAGALMPWAYGAGAPRWVGLALVAGAAFALAGQTYGAACGMYGIQVQDLRADALPMFVAKHLGLLAFASGFAAIGWRVLFRPPPGS